MYKIPYCLKNESSSKQSIKKFDKFTNDTFDAQIKSLTKKVKSMFRVKDKSLHQACKTCKGVCSCGENYISEISKNVEVHQGEHNNQMKKWNLSKHMKDNLDHVFNLPVLANSPLKIVSNLKKI